MDWIIKCSGECLVRCGQPWVSAYGFTVRRGHRIVHQKSGILAAERPVSVAEARAEAVQQALTWLLARPDLAGTVAICVDGLLLDSLPSAALAAVAELTALGWAVEMAAVCAERVSEATALSRRAARAALCEQGWNEQSDWAGLPPTIYSAAAPPAFRGDLAAFTWSPGAGADAIIVCDGGFKPAAGGGGLAVYGCLVWEQFRLTHQESGVVCRGRAAGSQVAELGAVVAALRWLADSRSSWARVEIRSDCQWVVQALGDEGHARPLPGTVMLLREARRLTSSLKRRGCHTSLWYVPRDLVHGADALCRQQYRGVGRLCGRMPGKTLKRFLQKGRAPLPRMQGRRAG